MTKLTCKDVVKFWAIAITILVLALIISPLGVVGWYGAQALMDGNPVRTTMMIGLAIQTVIFAFTIWVGVMTISFFMYWADL